VAAGERVGRRRQRRDCCPSFDSVSSGPSPRARSVSRTPRSEKAHERDQERGGDDLVDERADPVAEVLSRKVAKIENVLTESGLPRVMWLARSYESIAPL
jgi:hypothetical protein